MGRGDNRLRTVRSAIDAIVSFLRLVWRLRVRGNTPGSRNAADTEPIEVVLIPAEIKVYSVRGDARELFGKVVNHTTEPKDVHVELHVPDWIEAECRGFSKILENRDGWEFTLDAQRREPWDLVLWTPDLRTDTGTIELVVETDGERYERQVEVVTDEQWA